MGRAGIAIQRRRLIAAVVLLLGHWLASDPGFVAAADPPPRPVVRLIVDYGDGVQKHFTAVPWRKALTVLNALEACRKFPRGITFEHRGSGETAFVTAIDGQSNEGRGRNWTFRVNDQLAQQSCGVTELQAGDTILWRFAPGTPDRSERNE